MHPNDTNSRFFHDDLTPSYPFPKWSNAEAFANIYFKHVNQTTQLFAAPTFMKMLDEFYDGPPENRDQVTWSAINVVLALQFYLDPDKITAADARAAICIKRAQSVMDQLVYRTEDLLGLQVILGVAMFFMHTAHPHPACVLIATAVKLVHRLKLNVPPQTTEHHQQSAERARLFWLTYTMDRELSLRTSEPYLLQDHDIGIEIDDMSSSPGKGCVRIPPKVLRHSLSDPSERSRQYKEAVEINIPMTRARLAVIQGKIYDQVYSVRASRMSPSEKQQALEGLDGMLDDWYSSLPPNFKRSVQGFSISAHITYYQCLFSTRRATIHNTDWIKRLDDYASSKTRLNAAQRALLLPSNWLTLVKVARCCLTMLSKIPSRNTALRWYVPAEFTPAVCHDILTIFRSSTCVCEAAITVLAANNMTLGLHDVPRSIKEDEAKIDTALKEFEERLQGSNDEFLSKMYTECKSLSERAAVAADKFLDATVDQFWDAVVDGVIGQTAPQAMAFINRDRAP